jgi:hypothetical protein
MKLLLDFEEGIKWPVNSLSLDFEEGIKWPVNSLSFGLLPSMPNSAKWPFVG